jgi:hypothetical protein
MFDWYVHVAMLGDLVKGNNVSRSLVVNATKQRVNATKQRVSRLSSLWMASDGCLAHSVPSLFRGRTVASFSRLGLRKRHERHKTPGAFHPQSCPLVRKNNVLPRVCITTGPVYCHTSSGRRFCKNENSCAFGSFWAASSQSAGIALAA